MMRGFALVMLLIAMALDPPSSLAGCEIQERIERFMHILESNPSYYISNNYNLYGEGEMYIGERLCDENRKLSSKEKNLCADLRNRRFQEDSDVPSLLLLWLRTKLPKSPTITILNDEWMSRNTQRRVKVRLDNTLVIFNIFNEGESYNPMDIQSIDGVNLLDMIDDDIRNGLSVSELLKQIKK